jgi:hypothetical protein
VSSLLEGGAFKPSTTLAAPAFSSTNHDLLMAFHKRRSVSIRQRLQLCSLGVVAAGLTGGWLLQGGLERIQDPIAKSWSHPSVSLEAVQQMSSELAQAGIGELEQNRILQQIVDQSSSPGQMMVVSGPNQAVILPSSQALLRFDPNVRLQQLQRLPWLQPERLHELALAQGYRHQWVSLSPSGHSMHLIAKAAPSAAYESPLLWLLLAAGVAGVIAVIEASARPFERLAVQIGRIDPEAVSARQPAFLDSASFPVELNAAVKAVNRVLEKFAMLHAMVPGRLQPVARPEATAAKSPHPGVVAINDSVSSSRRAATARRNEDADQASRAA